MFTANGEYGKLRGSYLFYEMDKRTNAYREAHPAAELIKMGIGDVTQPLVPSVIRAMHRAVEEMGAAETFHGYPPAFGYDFLIEAILKRDYLSRGVELSPDEIFVSDGAKCDVGNFQELFSRDARIAVLDPVYPVYVDTNVMGGRSGAYDELKHGYERIVYLKATAENGFVPELPATPVDVIYLCYPNNPTGVMPTKAQLKRFVEYALETGTLLLYDSAYEAYISEDDKPHSIYQIEGAKACAVEFRSMSKTAGFTGTRCAYTVVPRDIIVWDEYGSSVRLNDLWKRRMSTKFNGVSYITQVGAAAAYGEGYSEILQVVGYYMDNAKRIRSAMASAGYEVYGGVNAPYVWIRVPDGDSWGFFDRLLEKCSIIATPGAGFGAAGEGYLRMTAFATKENTIKAMERIKGGLQ